MHGSNMIPAEVRRAASAVPLNLVEENRDIVVAFVIRLLR